jgi:hypothetical protein
VPRPATNGSRPCEMGEHRRGEVRARCAHALPTRFARWQWHPGWEPVPPYNAAMPETSPRQPARRWKRTIRGAAAALLLLAGGAVVNVAVAFGLILAFDTWRAELRVAEIEAVLSLRTQLPLHARDDRRGIYIIERANVPAVRTASSAWFRVQVTHGAAMHRQLDGGWPARSLRAELSQAEAFPPPGQRPMPRLRTPLWPGFAINTVFYAVLLWMLFAGPFALRRRLRIRRNQCAQCAYPIGVSPVCTECGAAVLRERG